MDNNTAVQFLHSMGHSVSKRTLLESELMILKVLDYRLNVPNPLTYVEILLEVLGELSTSHQPATKRCVVIHACDFIMQKNMLSCSVTVHNESSIPVEHLHHLCRHVLQFTYLQKTAIYDSLLMATTRRSSPSNEQR